MIDFTSKTKKMLPVKFANGTTVLLTVPKKKVFTRMLNFEKTLKEAEGNEITEIYDELLALAADILSCNKSGTPFTAEAADEIMDIEDMSYLIQEYGKFVSEATKSPN